MSRLFSYGIAQQGTTFADATPEVVDPGDDILIDLGPGPGGAPAAYTGPRDTGFHNFDGLARKSTQIIEDLPRQITETSGTPIEFLHGLGYEPNLVVITYTDKQMAHNVTYKDKYRVLIEFDVTDFNISIGVG